MTASDLKYHVVEGAGNIYFFDRNAMKFFGDTMKNYGVRSTFVWDGEREVDVWELHRKKPVKHGLTESYYFDKISFEMVRPQLKEEVIQTCSA